MLELIFWFFFIRQNLSQSEDTIHKTAILIFFFFLKKKLQESIGYVIIEEYYSRTIFFMFAHGKCILECCTNKNVLQNAVFVCPENNTTLFPYGSNS